MNSQYVTFAVSEEGVKMFGEKPIYLDKFAPDEYAYYLEMGYLHPHLHQDTQVIAEIGNWVIPIPAKRIGSVYTFGGGCYVWGPIRIADISDAEWEYIKEDVQGAAKAVFLRLADVSIVA